MKKLFLFFTGFLLLTQVQAQEIYHDSTALMILDKVGEYFGELNSLKFTAKTSQDVAYSDSFFIKEHKTTELIFQGADKLVAKVHQFGKDHYYYYNGSQMIYYSLEGNFYTAAEAPATTLETLDWLREEFGIELVVADFLYPDFTQDLIAQMDYLEFLGQSEIEGTKLFHIGGANTDMTFQIWVSQDVEMKPCKILLTYFDEPYSRQMEVVFEAWSSNQSYPNSIFEFMTPPNSTQITWTKKD